MLLDAYHELDDDNKKALMTTALSTNNLDLQHALISLHQIQNNPGGLAKLAKKLIKLAICTRLQNYVLKNKQRNADIITILGSLTYVQS